MPRAASTLNKFILAAFLTGWVSYAKLVFPIEEQPVNVACGLERNIDPQFLRQLRGGPSGHGVQRPGEGKEET